MKFMTKPSTNRIKEMSSSGSFSEQPPRFLARSRELQFVPVKLLALHKRWIRAVRKWGLLRVPENATLSVCPGLKQGEATARSL